MKSLFSLISYILFSFQAHSIEINIEKLSGELIVNSKRFKEKTIPLNTPFRVESGSYVIVKIDNDNDKLIKFQEQTEALFEEKFGQLSIIMSDGSAFAKYYDKDPTKKIFLGTRGSQIMLKGSTVFAKYSIEAFYLVSNDGNAIGIHRPTGKYLPIQKGEAFMMSGDGTVFRSQKLRWPAMIHWDFTKHDMTNSDLVALQTNMTESFNKEVEKSKIANESNQPPQTQSQPQQQPQTQPQQQYNPAQNNQPYNKK